MTHCLTLPVQELSAEELERRTRAAIRLQALRRGHKVRNALYKVEKKAASLQRRTSKEVVSDYRVFQEKVLGALRAKGIDVNVEVISCCGVQG